MRICILHHHFDTGGVTSIIKSQALASRGLPKKISDLCLLLGRPPGSLPAGIKRKNIRVHPLLNYLPEKLPAGVLKKKRAELEAFLTDSVSREDILHIHNINLGKNPLLCIVIWELASRGYKIFNHCHDFAEDGRFDNIRHMRHVIERVFKLPLNKICYPDFPGYFYGAINSRDFTMLKKAGVPAGRLQLILNPVNSPGFPRKRSANFINRRLSLQNNNPLVVFPVRGIRRKNLGEFILLSALFKNEVNFLLTLNPKNPLEIPNYKSWKTFSKKYSLPVTFEAGLKVDFFQLLMASHQMITTSVIEGFGMIFLESWMWEREIIGRDIPAITGDFKKKGIRFSKLYRHLKIPADWITDPDRLNNKYHNYMSGFYRKAKLTVPGGLKTTLKKSLWKNKSVDFCYLDMANQQRVIKRVQANPRDADYLKKSNSIFNILSKPDKKVISRNRGIIKREMNLKKYGVLLNTLYSRMNSTKVTGTPKKQNTIKGEKVFLEFLKPENFYLLRK